MRNCFFIMAFFTVAYSCTSDSTADLTIPQASVISYNSHVKQIIDNNCIVCHAAQPVNGAPMPLTTYEHVKDAINNRGLINRITKQNGEPGLMPNGGPRLPQHVINQVIQWQAQGLQQ